MTMKQRITVEQLKELTGAQQERLRVWYDPVDGDWFYRSPTGTTGVYGMFEPEKIDLPLLSIGQMIELLNDGNRRISIEVRNREWQVVAHVEHAAINHELCDALWDITKKVL
ncbi:hypothetical protein [Paenibacillus ihumii]|uniref:hypothetical protein n=1 Tax=Paenibacillus ihumii TaxID=687436 RepID=UPI0006D76C1B|nr:hypothetical protein [Paenibacillus ihumii]